MISIRKHLEQLDQSGEVRAGALAALEAVLETTSKRIPCRDEAARSQLAAELKQRSLKAGRSSSADGAEQAVQSLVEALEAQWDEAAAMLQERERGLRDIIALLARTAGSLDASNRNFYQHLHTTVSGLEAVGEIEDLTTLRRTLSSRLASLEAAVSQQEETSGRALADLQSGLADAEAQASTIGRLVSSGPLDALPGKRHAMERLGELTQGNQRFSVGLVSLTKLDVIVRRYEAATAEALLVELRGRLQSAAPGLSLYAWDEATILAITDPLQDRPLAETLAALEQDCRARPLAANTEIKLRVEPACAAYERKEDDATAALLERIESLRQALTKG